VYTRERPSRVGGGVWVEAEQCDSTAAHESCLEREHSALASGSIRRSAKLAVDVSHPWRPAAVRTGRGKKSSFEHAPSAPLIGPLSARCPPGGMPVTCA
jgi:hypothetical protein